MLASDQSTHAVVNFGDLQTSLASGGAGHTPQRAEAEDHDCSQVGHWMRGGLAFSLEPILVMERDGFDEAAGADDSTVGKIADPMEQLVDKPRIFVWFPRTAS